MPFGQSALISLNEFNPFVDWMKLTEIHRSFPCALLSQLIHYVHLLIHAALPFLLAQLKERTEMGCASVSSGTNSISFQSLSSCLLQSTWSLPALLYSWHSVSNCLRSSAALIHSLFTQHSLACFQSNSICFKLTHRFVFVYNSWLAAYTVIILPFSFNHSI